MYVLGSVLLWFHFNCNLKLLFQKYYESTKIYIDICGLILPSRKTLTHLHCKCWFSEWRKIKYIHGLHWVWSPWFYFCCGYSKLPCTIQLFAFKIFPFLNIIFSTKKMMSKNVIKNLYLHLKFFSNTIYDLILHLFTVFRDYYFNKI